MIAAGYILTGVNRHRSRAHSPHILAHSLASAFFGVEELEEWFPDYEGFAVWPATARLLAVLRRIERPDLPGRLGLEYFGHRWNPATRRVTLCCRGEARRGVN